MSDSRLFEKHPWPNPPEESTTFFVIYEKPIDHPDLFVVRRWFIYGGNQYAEHVPRLAHTLEDAREHVPEGRIRLERFPGDATHIKEVWF